MKIKHNDVLSAELDNGEGLIRIEGKSILEDSASFYKTLIKWLEEYTGQPHDETNVELYLEYYNTLSSKYLHTLFTRLERLHESGLSNVSLNWHYENDDEDMKFTGERFQETFNMPVNLIAIEEFEFSSN